MTVQPRVRESDIYLTRVDSTKGNVSHSVRKRKKYIVVRRKRRKPVEFDTPGCPYDVFLVCIQWYMKWAFELSKSIFQFLYKIWVLLFWRFYFDIACLVWLHPHRTRLFVLHNGIYDDWLARYRNIYYVPSSGYLSEFAFELTQVRSWYHLCCHWSDQ